MFKHLTPNVPLSRWDLNPQPLPYQRSALTRLCHETIWEGCGIWTHVSFLTVLQTVPFNHSGNPSENPACQRTTYRINNLQRLFMMFITCKSYIFEPGIRIELMSPEYHTEILPLNYPDLFERTTKNPMFLRHRVLFNSTISLFKMKTITRYQYYFCRL